MNGWVDAAIGLGIYIGFMSVVTLTFYYLWHWGE